MNKEIKTTDLEKPKERLFPYVLFGVLFPIAMVFIPVAVLLILQEISFSTSFSSDISQFIGKIINVGYFVIVFALYFLFMWIFIPRQKLSINKLLIPLYVRVGYQIAAWSVVMIVDAFNHSVPATDMIINVTVSIAALVLSFEVENVSNILGILINEAVIVASFVIVVLLRKRKYGIAKKLSFKIFIPIASVIVILPIVASCINTYSYRNYIDVSYAEEGEYFESYGGFSGGHGFAYEFGWSSIDLKPYYVENENNILAKLDEESTFKVSKQEDMPVLDGAEAAYPLYSAFAEACYENIDEIQTAAKEKKIELYDRWSDKRPPDAPVQFTNTVEGFKGLISGEVDIFFGAKPSAAQKKMAEEAGKELILTPIGKEAFVFFVSENNPVDTLTSQQVKDIYSGKITNWSAVGGNSESILAFQRPENSGSQTMMQYFMGDTPLKEPLMVEFERSMMGVIHEVAKYQDKTSSIGYSFRYYSSLMQDKKIKFISLDGVYPDAETIRSGEYPMTTELYAITVKDNDNKNITPFLDWMVGEQGQKLVSDTGYISYFSA